ncbi:MAG TPA: pitrilysin family protein [Steroidobacteraceae bacterium]|nr:pitrilysin family protein [Steroidobacteraceae bacterium]
MRRKLLWVLAALIVPSAWGQIPGAQDVREMTLKNGMQIIVWPDHDIPNVALYNWVKVGSRNEVPGITGLAHFFEHMMFNGTSTRPPGDFDRTLEANGASNNAFTTSDVTVYQDWFPRAALETIFDVEADRLKNLAFDPKIIESERGVVYSERRMRVEDSHVNRLEEQVQATAFLAHPYGIPTIGWPSDIESWTIEDLKAFFAKYYAPNNCTMVLVGDIEPEEAFALARKYLEPIPRNTPPDPVHTREPEQQGERRVTLQVDAQTPVIEIAYHSISGADSRQATLELLTRILTDGDASRLHRSLVEEQKLAISVDSNVDDGFDPGLTWFYLSLPAGGDLQKTEAQFDAQIEALVRDGVTADELNRARSQALADFWRALTTIDGKAHALGQFAVLRGGYQHLFDAPKQYESVTAQDIQKLAAELLTKTNRTVGLAVTSAGKEAQQ